MNVQPVQDLPEFATWLNAKPTTLAELQGRPVVLAFVNAASVWCAQRLAELAQWQSRNPGKLQLLVLQVPRFDGERDPDQSLKSAGTATRRRRSFQFDKENEVLEDDQNNSEEEEFLEKKCF